MGGLVGCKQHGKGLTIGCMGCEPGRRRDAWARWVASIAEWHLFGGLTFDPRRTVGFGPAPGPQRGKHFTRQSPRLWEDGRAVLRDAPVSADVARGRVRRFLREGEQLLGRKLTAVVALEYQKNGWPHFHPLLSVEGGLQGREIETLGGLWFRLAGGNRLERPRSVGDVSAYASKYLTKGLEEGDVLLWPERGPLGSRVLALPLGDGRRP